MREKTKAVLLKEVLEKENEIKVKVRGVSMFPFLRRGHSLLVSGTDCGQIRVGNIILYYDEGEIYCHRVFSKKDGSITVKADANVCAEPLSPEDLIGKVVAIERKGRTIRIDNTLGYIRGLFISRLSLFTSFLLNTYGILKNVIKKTEKKTCNEISEEV
jgi:signal peptidase I